MTDVATLPQREQDGEPAPMVNPSQSSRLVVVESVYHQPADGPPTTATGDIVRFGRDLASDEQPYERHKVVKESWEPLDCGWIDRCGMLLLRNDEGHFAINPTPEQREAAMRRVIELSFDGEHSAISVPPRESCRFYPADAGNIRLRCREGSARYTVHLTPE